MIRKWEKVRFSKVVFSSVHHGVYIPCKYLLYHVLVFHHIERCLMSSMKVMMPWNVSMLVCHSYPLPC